MAEFILRVFDVEHGACSIMMSPTGEKIAMVDSGHNSTTGWRPSTYIKGHLKRTELDYLFVTNADQDHLSDLEGFWEQEVHVKTLTRNKSISAEDLRTIKEQQGECTDDVERFLKIHGDYNSPTKMPFNENMGGVTFASFGNRYPDFTDTNNLSLAVFVKYGHFKMLFPGDLEEDGWLKLLENPKFTAELAGTEILLASHHGRENGFCEDVFKYFEPWAVVISDKPIAHETQEMVPDYRNVVRADGVAVSNQPKRRHVLTTRRDGDIIFKVGANGDFTIITDNG